LVGYAKSEERAAKQDKENEESMRRALAAETSKTLPTTTSSTMKAINP
jgi:hypothetical protein